MQFVLYLRRLQVPSYPCHQSIFFSSISIYYYYYYREYENHHSSHHTLSVVIIIIVEILHSSSSPPSRSFSSDCPFSILATLLQGAKFNTAVIVIVEKKNRRRRRRLSINICSARRVLKIERCSCVVVYLFFYFIIMCLFVIAVHIFG